MQTIAETDARNSLPRLALATVLLVGCGSSGVTRYTPTRPVPQSFKSFEDVLMTYAVPAKPFKVTGEFRTSGYDHPDAPLARMRQYAAALGLDGVAMIRCKVGDTALAAPGTVGGPGPIPEAEGSGNCAGQGFVWVNR